MTNDNQQPEEQDQMNVLIAGFREGLTVVQAGSGIPRGTVLAAMTLACIDEWQASEAGLAGLRQALEGAEQLAAIKALTEGFTQS